MRKTKLADGRKAWEVCPEKNDTIPAVLNLGFLILSIGSMVYLINLFQ